MELLDRDKRDGYVYDVLIKGLDANFWANVTGTPILSAGTILLNAAKMSSYILHEYADIEFALTVPAKPTSGDVRSFGLYAPATKTVGAAYFDIAGTVFSAKIADNSGNITSNTLTWDDTNWTAKVASFRIHWEKDTIQFWTGIVTGGVMAWTLQCTFPTSVVGIPQPQQLPLMALPITINNGNSDNLALSYLAVRQAAGIV